MNDNFADILKSNIALKYKYFSDFLDILQKSDKEFSSLDATTLSRWINGKTTPSLYKRLFMYLLLDVNFEEQLQLEASRYNRKPSPQYLTDALFCNTNSRLLYFKDKISYSLYREEELNLFSEPLNCFNKNNIIAKYTYNRSDIKRLKSFLIIGHICSDSIECHLSFSICKGPLSNLPAETIESVNNEYIFFNSSNISHLNDFKGIVNAYLHSFLLNSRRYINATHITNTSSVNFKNFLCHLGCEHISTVLQGNTQIMTLVFTPLKLLSTASFLSNFINFQQGKESF